MTASDGQLGGGDAPEFSRNPEDQAPDRERDDDVDMSLDPDDELRRFSEDLESDERLAMLELDPATGVLDEKKYFEAQGLLDVAAQTLMKEKWELAQTQVEGSYNLLININADEVKSKIDGTDLSLPIKSALKIAIPLILGSGSATIDSVLALALLPKKMQETGNLNAIEVFGELKDSLASYRGYVNTASFTQVYSENEIAQAISISEASGVPAEWILAIGKIETNDSSHIKSPADCVGTWQHQPETARPLGEVVFYKGSEKVDDTTITRDGVRVKVSRHGDYYDESARRYYMPEDQRRERLYALPATAVIGYSKLRQFTSGSGSWWHAAARYNGGSLKPDDNIQLYVLNMGVSTENRMYTIKALYAMKGAIEAVKQFRAKNIKYEPQYEVVKIPQAGVNKSVYDIGLDNVFNGMNEDLMPRIPLSSLKQPLVIPAMPIVESGFSMDTLIGYLKREFDNKDKPGRQHIADSTKIQKQSDGSYIIQPGAFKAPSSDTTETSIDVSFGTSGKMGTYPPTLSDIPVPFHKILAANPQLKDSAKEPDVAAYFRSIYLRPNYELIVPKGKKSTVETAFGLGTSVPSGPRETSLTSEQWAARRRLDRELRKFILNETHDKDTNPDAGKGEKQKKRVKDMKGMYEKGLGLTSSDTRVKEIGMLGRTQTHFESNAKDDALFDRIFEDRTLAREWIDFCYLQSKMIYEDRGNGRIEVDDYKFVAITMTLFDIASRQLPGFSSEDFQRLTETIEWYEGVKSQALTNVTRIKEAKEFEKQNLHMRAGTIYMEVGVGSGEALDYALAILAVAQKREPLLAEIKSRLAEADPFAREAKEKIEGELKKYPYLEAGDATKTGENVEIPIILKEDKAVIAYVVFANSDTTKFTIEYLSGSGKSRKSEWRVDEEQPEAERRSNKDLTQIEPDNLKDALFNHLYKALIYDVKKDDDGYPAGMAKFNDFLNIYTRKNDARKYMLTLAPAEVKENKESVFIGSIDIRPEMNQPNYIRVKSFTWEGGTKPKEERFFGSISAMRTGIGQMTFVKRP